MFCEICALFVRMTVCDVRSSAAVQYSSVHLQLYSKRAQTSWQQTMELVKVRRTYHNHLHRLTFFQHAAPERFWKNSTRVEFG